MEKPPQSFDVCIVCALPEEARAFLKVVQQQCKVAFEKHISTQYKYDHQLTTIKNDKGEPLNLHVSWLPRYGPQEMTLHLSRVLSECQPRIAIMTGICAGDAQRVQLGDLVVAERTFAYDNGKFTLDEHGRKVHLHDTLTYQLDANILQFLGLFDEWKPLVARLQRPPSPSEQHKKRKIACHLKAMASGSAVRADNPFEDVRAPVRGTVAIDMEGAAFGLVMSRHPLIRWLVVKGVCDYADKTKNDAYHDYAAHASALYALGFIRAYVTNERLPRLDGSSPSSRAGPPEAWNIPFARNPFFTGRDRELEDLSAQLQQNSSAAVGQMQSISGLGGIGKTQLAVEYVYRHHDEYHYVLWARAESIEALISSFTEIARLLDLPEKDAQEQETTLQAVKGWLQRERGWLLILDNADQPELLQSFLPRRLEGHVMLTTRAADVSHLGLGLGHALTLQTFTNEQGALFLLYRSGLLAAADRLQDASAQDCNVALHLSHELGGLPLALDQAGAYLKATSSSLITYRQIYRQHRAQLLNERRGADHTEPVATTWNISFRNVEQQNPAAADLLRLCAFLAPDAIPEEIITESAEELGVTLEPIADPLLFNKAIESLHAYSLIVRDPREHTLTVHRLVQAVLRDSMPAKVQQQWMLRAVHVVAAAYPESPDVANWPTFERLLPHARTCVTWIEQTPLVTPEASLLLIATAYYLDNRAQYEEAEPLLKRALAIREQRLGPEHPDTATSLNNLAMLYKTQGKYEEAEPLLKRALAIREQRLGLEHPDTATSLNNLAMLYWTQGRYEEAEPLLRRALAIRELRLGPEHPNTARSLNSLAALCYSQGKYEEAESLYQRALAICEQELGATHPDTARSLNSLAALYYSQGKYEEAESLYQRALAIDTKVYGTEHPNVALDLNNLAALYDDQRKYREAESLYQRALAIRELRLGPGHPDTATSLNNLAMLYKTQGKYEEAEPLYQRALAIFEQELGATHPNTASSLNNLAAFYYSQGKYEEAEPLLKRALEIREQESTAMHPDTASCLNNLAFLYMIQGRYGEAEPLYQRALAIYEHILGRQHPNTQTARQNFITLLLTMGRDAETKKLEEGL